MNLADWSKFGSTIGLCEFLSRPIVGHNVNTLDTQRSHVNAMYIRIKKVSKNRDTVYNRMRLTRVWKPVENQILTSIKKHKFSFSQVLYIVPQFKRLAYYDRLARKCIYILENGPNEKHDILTLTM